MEKKTVEETLWTNEKNEGAEVTGIFPALRPRKGIAVSQKEDRIKCELF